VGSTEAPRTNPFRALPSPAKPAAGFLAITNTCAPSERLPTRAASSPAAYKRDAPRESTPPELIPITNFKQADWQKFGHRTHSRSPDCRVAQFTEVLKTAQSQSVPPKFIPINKRPILARILALIREKRRFIAASFELETPR
jgi:hypothetical protein